MSPFAAGLHASLQLGALPASERRRPAVASRIANLDRRITSRLYYLPSVMQRRSKKSPDLHLIELDYEIADIIPLPEDASAELIYETHNKLVELAFNVGNMQVVSWLGLWAQVRMLAAGVR